MTERSIEPLLSLRRGKPASFASLPIGARFDEGYETWSGAKSGTFGWIVYEKITPSRAKGVEQRGYDNQRAVGGEYVFAVNKTVWPHKK